MTELCTTIDCDYLGPEFAAAYLRVSGDECAFIETNTSHAVPKLLAALHAAGRTPESVRFIVVTHVHLDHAGGAGTLAEACPRATVLAHPQAARHLRDPAKLVAGAKAVYGEARFAELYGEIPAIDAHRVRELQDGERVDFGAGSFRVHFTRGHARHHFVVEDAALDAVFTGDTFGLAYPQLQRAGLFAFPSTSPTGFEAEEALASLDRVLGLGRSTAYLTHYGAYRDQLGIAAQLRPWLRLSAELQDRARGLGESAHAEVHAALRQRMQTCAAEVGLELTPNDWEVLELDLDLNAQGIVAAAAR